MKLPKTLRRRHAGFSMIEVLVSLLVVSFGMLAMVGLQASAIRMATDARDRGAATFLADQLLARLLISDRAIVSLASFPHNAAAANCAAGTAPSTNPVVTSWLAEVSRSLPNASASLQKVVVRDAASGDIDVVVCWRRGSDLSEPLHSLTVSNRVQWQ
jgi:type IV pilus assembly protein PilV